MSMGPYDMMNFIGGPSYGYLPLSTPASLKKKPKCKPSKLRRQKLLKKKESTTSKKQTKTKVAKPIQITQVSKVVDPVEAEKRKKITDKRREKRKRTKVRERLKQAQADVGKGDDEGAVECSICMEVPDGKHGTKLYGLLDRCNHSFCLNCIRSWRNEPLTSRDTYSHSKEKQKACPLCRGESSYLVPSAKHLIGEEKQKFFDQYLSQKANRDCRFFIRSIRGKSRKPQEGKEKEKEKEEGKDANGKEKNKRAKLQPWCPFFDDCHHRHEIDPESGPYIFNKRADSFVKRPRAPGAPSRNVPTVPYYGGLPFGFFFGDGLTHVA